MPRRRNSPRAGSCNRCKAFRQNRRRYSARPCYRSPARRNSRRRSTCSVRFRDRKRRRCTSVRSLPCSPRTACPRYRKRDRCHPRCRHPVRRSSPGMTSVSSVAVRKPRHCTFVPSPCSPCNSLHTYRKRCRATGGCSGRSRRSSRCTRANNFLHGRSSPRRRSHWESRSSGRRHPRRRLRSTRRRAIRPEFCPRRQSRRVRRGAARTSNRHPSWAGSMLQKAFPSNSTPSTANQQGIDVPH
jgi:hypothetical protein